MALDLLSNEIWNWQWTERGKECSKFRDLDTRIKLSIYRTWIRGCFVTARWFNRYFCTLVLFEGKNDIKYHYYLSREEENYMTLSPNDRRSVDKNIYSIIGTHNLYKTDYYKGWNTILNNTCFHYTCNTYLIRIHLYPESNHSLYFHKNDL